MSADCPQKWKQTTLGTMITVITVNGQGSSWQSKCPWLDFVQNCRTHTHASGTTARQKKKQKRESQRKKLTIGHRPVSGQQYCRCILASFDSQQTTFSFFSLSLSLIQYMQFCFVLARIILFCKLNSSAKGVIRHKMGKNETQHLLFGQRLFSD